MVDADKTKFGQCLALLAEVYGPLTVLKTQAYWLALREQDIRDLEAAVVRCLKTRRSSDGYPAPWPTPADLIALMYTNLDRQDVSDAPVAQRERKALPEPPPDPEQWARLKALIRETIAKLDGIPEGGSESPLHKHADSLRRKGLEASAALKHAQAMVADPGHRAGCPVCTPRPWE